jgi:hypothetical protein
MIARAVLQVQRANRELIRTWRQRKSDLRREGLDRTNSLSEQAADKRVAILFARNNAEFDTLIGLHRALF